MKFHVSSFFSFNIKLPLNNIYVDKWPSNVVLNCTLETQKRVSATSVGPLINHNALYHLTLEQTRKILGIL